MENPFQETLIQKSRAEPCTVVIFGATGDLTHRKLIPALYNIAAGGDLPPQFKVVGFARREKTDEVFRTELETANKTTADSLAKTAQLLASLLGGLPSAGGGGTPTMVPVPGTSMALPKDFGAYTVADFPALSTCKSTRALNAAIGEDPVLQMVSGGQSTSAPPGPVYEYIQAARVKFAVKTTKAKPVKPATIGAGGFAASITKLTPTATPATGADMSTFLPVAVAGVTPDATGEIAIETTNFERNAAEEDSDSDNSDNDATGTKEGEPTP